MVVSRTTLQDAVQVAVRETGTAHGQQGLGRTVVRGIADAIDAQLAAIRRTVAAEIEDHLEIIVAGKAPGILEDVFQPEIIRAQDEAGGLALDDDKVGTDAETSQGSGIEATRAFSVSIAAASLNLSYFRIGLMLCS